MTDRALKSTYLLFCENDYYSSAVVVWMNTAANDQSCFKPHSCSTCAHNTHTLVLVPLVHTTLTQRFLFHLCTQHSHIGSCSTCAHNAHTTVLVPLVHTTLTHWFLFHLCTQRSHNGSCSTCACNTQASVLAPLVRTTHTHISLICYDWCERVMSVHGTTKHSMCNYSVH